MWVGSRKWYIWALTMLSLFLLSDFSPLTMLSLFPSVTQHRDTTWRLQISHLHPFHHPSPQCHPHPCPRTRSHLFHHPRYHPCPRPHRHLHPQRQDNWGDIRNHAISNQYWGNCQLGSKEIDTYEHGQTKFNQILKDYLFRDGGRVVYSLLFTVHFSYKLCSGF